MFNLIVFPTSALLFAYGLDRTRSEGPQTALCTEMCMAQHLSLPALTGRSPIIGYAAVRPVKPDIRCNSKTNA